MRPRSGIVSEDGGSAMNASAPQHYNRTQTHDVVRRFQCGLVSRFSDIFRAGPRGIDDAPPVGSLSFRHPEGVILPTRLVPEINRPVRAMPQDIFAPEDGPPDARVRLAERNHELEETSRFASSRVQSSHVMSTIEVVESLAVFHRFAFQRGRHLMTRSTTRQPRAGRPRSGAGHRSP